ncbi:MAG TPA: zonular occludens toxin domain-containing protein [Solirubrobacteraceae bacterium]|jgi:hypothetical protein|nr:zonular occludens toxin domain-containing protein [Solirubrobacteraceae bacterium]
MTLVTGPPGTGKTWFCVRLLAKMLLDDKYVATNVKLHDGWAYQVAKANLWAWFRGGKKRVLECAERYEERVFISASLTELFALRLPPCGKCKACRRDRSCQVEGRGCMILDEAHEWLNARMWDVDESGGKRNRDQAVQARLAVVRFFALHRKLGWNVWLITQSEKRLDNQVRDNFEYHTKLKNMRKFRLLGLIPFVPFNWFIAITFWHASGGERVSIQSYLLTKLANVYDTMARPELSFEGENEQIIALPLSRQEIAEREVGDWRPPWMRTIVREPAGRPQPSASEARPDDRLPAPPAPAGAHDD